ncbi:MAG: M28 family peptidase [Anaerolineales bacterium]|nr:M28 family peptidase [Anaerolineales bacterium]
MDNRSIFLKLFLLTCLIILFTVIFSAGCSEYNEIEKEIPGFNGERAYSDVEYQVSLGPRIPGTPGQDQILKWLNEELTQYGWDVELQVHEIKGKTITNLIASRGEDGQYILLGAHYDTRIFADLDPDPGLRNSPVPGANDGGSGVAVLLEMARILPDDLHMPVQIVFFDAEDNGGIGDWDWILGSRAFVKQLEIPPEAAIIVDMVGDADLKIYKEYNSNDDLIEQIWEKARLLGYDEVFLSEYKFSVLDDHTPFIEAGIPAVDIIDLDYPYWHTTADTADKVSVESLQIVGDTLLAWILSLE